MSKFKLDINRRVCSRKIEFTIPHYFLPPVNEIADFYV